MPSIGHSSQSRLVFTQISLPNGSQMLYESTLIERHDDNAKPSSLNQTIILLYPSYRFRTLFKGGVTKPQAALPRESQRSEPRPSSANPAPPGSPGEL